MYQKLRIAFLVATVSFAQVATAENAEADPTTPEEANETEGSSSENRKWDSEERQAALRVQLFLDSKGFGPGKIDGYWGGFSEKAAVRWNEAENGTPVATLDGGALDVEMASKLPFPGELLTNYTITPEDGGLLGSLPDEPEQKAKLDKLPYETLLELVSERFHSDQQFILEINGLKSGKELKTGMQLKVPNVTEPFDISVPMELAKAPSKEESGEESVKAKTGEEKAEKLMLTVLREKLVVEVREEGKLIHSFPISPGANDNQSPAGDWEVSIVSWMPEFRWDKAMLESGKRSSDAFFLPPGPNNPVGIVWIGLTADGIGLHGTPHPDAIGRNVSHGCIRLSNWDALKLGKVATVGTPVIIK